MLDSGNGRVGNLIRSGVEITVGEIAIADFMLLASSSAGASPASDHR